MSKFQNKYRIESTRLKNWDYSNPAWYYVTINTKNHISFFGKIENGKMILNYLGKIAEEEWLKTQEIRSNVDLDYYVVMPNHIHGIIILNNENRGDVARYVSTNGNKFSKISPKENSLSSIIRSFKSAVTKHIHELGYSSFSWQPRYYDRIIRNEKELYNIRKYIEQNPIKWGLTDSVL